MRHAIREALLADIPALQEIWQPGMADKDTAKPYGVVKNSGEYVNNIRHSYNRTIDVWVYTDRTDYANIDELIEKVIECLTTKDLTTDDGYIFRLTCNAVSGDGFFDKDLEAIGKYVSLTHYLLRG